MKLRITESLVLILVVAYATGESVESSKNEIGRQGRLDESSGYVIDSDSEASLRPGNVKKRSISTIIKLLLGGNVPPNHPLVKSSEPKSWSLGSNILASIPGSGWGQKSAAEQLTSILATKAKILPYTGQVASGLTGIASVKGDVLRQIHSLSTAVIAQAAAEAAAKAVSSAATAQAVTSSVANAIHQQKAALFAQHGGGWESPLGYHSINQNAYAAPTGTGGLFGGKTPGEQPGPPYNSPSAQANLYQAPSYQNSYQQNAYGSNNQQLSGAYSTVPQAAPWAAPNSGYQSASSYRSPALGGYQSNANSAYQQSAPASSQQYNLYNPYSSPVSSPSQISRQHINEMDGNRPQGAQGYNPMTESYSLQNSQTNNNRQAGISHDLTIETTNPITIETTVNHPVDRSNSMNSHTTTTNPSDNSNLDSINEPYRTITTADANTNTNPDNPESKKSNKPLSHTEMTIRIENLSFPNIHSTAPATFSGRNVKNPQQTPSILSSLATLISASTTAYNALNSGANSLRASYNPGNNPPVPSPSAHGAYFPQPQQHGGVPRPDSGSRGPTATTGPAFDIQPSPSVLQPLSSVQHEQQQAQPLFPSSGFSGPNQQAYSAPFNSPSPFNHPQHFPHEHGQHNVQTSGNAYNAQSVFRAPYSGYPGGDAGPSGSSVPSGTGPSSGYASGFRSQHPGSYAYETRRSSSDGYTGEASGNFNRPSGSLGGSEVARGGQQNFPVYGQANNPPQTNAYQPSYGQAEQQHQAPLQQSTYNGPPQFFNGAPSGQQTNGFGGNGNQNMIPTLYVQPQSPYELPLQQKSSHSQQFPVVLAPSSTPTGPQPQPTVLQYQPAAFQERPTSYNKDARKGWNSYPNYTKSNRKGYHDTGTGIVMGGKDDIGIGISGSSGKNGSNIGNRDKNRDEGTVTNNMGNGGYTNEEETTNKHPVLRHDDPLTNHILVDDSTNFQKNPQRWTTHSAEKWANKFHSQHSHEWQSSDFRGTGTSPVRGTTDDGRSSGELSPIDSGGGGTTGNDGRSGAELRVQREDGRVPSRRGGGGGPQLERGYSTVPVFLQGKQGAAELDGNNETRAQVSGDEFTGNGTSSSAETYEKVNSQITGRGEDEISIGVNNAVDEKRPQKHRLINYKDQHHRAQEYPLAARFFSRLLG